jgi:tetratricopeptide (TPR) repeat protein
MTVRYWIIISLLAVSFFLCLPSWAAKRAQKLDSLQQIIQHSNADTSQVEALNALAQHMVRSHPDSAATLLHRSLKLAKKLEWDKGMANAYQMLGDVSYLRGKHQQSLKYYDKALRQLKNNALKRGQAGVYADKANVNVRKGNYNKAIQQYNKAKKIYQKFDDQQGMARVFVNIGLVHGERGHYPKSLEYLLKGLKIKQETGDNVGLAVILGNIGVLYQKQNNYNKALAYFKRALKKSRKIKDKRSIIVNLGNIGSIYKKQGHSIKALRHYFQALEKSKKYGDQRSLATNLIHIGQLLGEVTQQPDSFQLTVIEQFYPHLLSKQEESGQFVVNPAPLLLDTAIHLQLRALHINKKMKDKERLIKNYAGLGKVFFLKENYSQALDWYQQGYQLAEEIQALSTKQKMAHGLSRCYEKLENTDKALRWYKRYMSYKDSLFNKEKQ